MPKTHFRQKDIAPLAATYRLAKTFRGGTLYQRLNGTATIYFGYKETADQNTPNQDIKEELDAVLKTISRLERQRKKLSGGARAAFRRAVSGFKVEALTAAVQETKKTDDPVQRVSLRHGLPFYKIDMGDGSHTLIQFDDELIDEALFSLRTYIEVARSEIRARPPGRKQSESLRLCIFNLASIWCDYRREPFRVTYVKGEPKSEAARFCVDAMKLIDPKIQKPRIITAMRSYASEARKQKSQEMGSENS
jgi:uncharacterized protein (UPF0335 family)